FTVRLDTATAGTKNGQISFANNDSDEKPFNFAITGTVTAPSNQAPVLAPIGNRLVNEATALTFTASATDPDNPAQTLTFSLDTGAPLGASINATTGVFTWTPAQAQGPGLFTLTVRV